MSDPYNQQKIDLILNHMGREKYNELSSSGQLNPMELYLVDEENLDAIGNTIINVADPVLSNDAATKNYVDLVAMGNRVQAVSSLPDPDLSNLGRIFAVFDESERTLSAKGIVNSTNEKWFSDGNPPYPEGPRYSVSFSSESNAATVLIESKEQFLDLAYDLDYTTNLSSEELSEHPTLNVSVDVSEIDLNGKVFTPINLYNTSKVVFSTVNFFGRSDGGTTFRNIVVKTSDNYTPCGFIRYASNMDIRNITIDNEIIASPSFMSSSGTQTCGFLLGIAFSNISCTNVLIENSTMFGSDYSGLVVGSLNEAYSFFDFSTGLSVSNDALFMNGVGEGAEERHNDFIGIYNSTDNFSGTPTVVDPNTVYRNLQDDPFPFDVPTFFVLAENPVLSTLQYFKVDKDEIFPTIAFDSTPTIGSKNAVTSDGIRKALDLKQDELTSEQLSDLSSVKSKLEQSSAAPVFSELSSYDVGDYVTFNGSLYRFTTLHLGDWVDEDVESVDMSSPDATLNLNEYGALQVVGRNGEIIWRQGYNLSLSSSRVLSNETVNQYNFPANSTDAVQLLFPQISEEKAEDFILDVTNPELDFETLSVDQFNILSTYSVGDICLNGTTLWKCTSEVSAAGEWTGYSNWLEAYPGFDLGLGLGIEFNVVVPRGDVLSNCLRIIPGEMSEFYFTRTSFQIDGLPTYKICKQKVEKA